MDSFAFPVLEGPSAAQGGAGPAVRAAALAGLARADAAAAASAAAARGHAEGYAAGVSEAADRVEAAVVALQLACSSFASAVDERVQAIEVQAAELAVALAEKIVATALEVKPELVVDVVAGTLRGLTERDHVVIEVSPDDLELVRAAREELVERLGGFTRVEITPERRIARGGCVVQTTEGEIDGRPAKQLERATAVLRSALAERD
jgi:flagellar assembly protein FliH